MRIRCQRCQALFSLPDGVLGSGARLSVQCGRCLSVFEAVALSRTPPPPPADAFERAPPPDRPPTPPPMPGAAVPAEEAPAAVRGPESRRAMWLRVFAGFTAAAMVIAVVVALRRGFAGVPRDVAARLEQGRERMLRDDARSLDEAVRIFTEAVRTAPGEATPEAERGFALLLQAAAHKDLAERLPQAEREEEYRVSARFAQQGTAAAHQAFSEDQFDAAAVRAMALSEAVAGAADLSGAHAAQAAALAPDDPWTLYAQAAAARAGRSPERAVEALTRLRDAQPRLLRAQVDLAAAALDRRDPATAREALRAVLEQNSQHERARRLLRLAAP